MVPSASVATGISRETHMNSSWLSRLLVLLALCGGVACPGGSPAAQVVTVTVVEYYNAALDAYFITGRPQEQGYLDGLGGDFVRTGMTLRRVHRHRVQKVKFVSAASLSVSPIRLSAPTSTVVMTLIAQRCVVPVLPGLLTKASSSTQCSRRATAPAFRRTAFRCIAVFAPALAADRPITATASRASASMP